MRVLIVASMYSLCCFCHLLICLDAAAWVLFLVGTASMTIPAVKSRHREMVVSFILRWNPSNYRG